MLTITPFYLNVLVSKNFLNKFTGSYEVWDENYAIIIHPKVTHFFSRSDDNIADMRIFYVRTALNLGS
jgi:hypothetical protein